MTIAKEIFDFLNNLAPLELAESYDNPGLLAGSGRQQVTKALVALDITKEVCLEAAQKGAELVISHHPIIFNPVSAVLREGQTAALWLLVGSGLTAICMHTNLDIADGGVNDALCSALGFEKTELLLVKGNWKYKKITVFVPRDSAEKVRTQMSLNGAGQFGGYDSCAFETAGSGYFRPLEGSKPFIGQTGELKRVDEIKIEAVCAGKAVGGVIRAIKKAHPYEQPAIDVFDDEALSAPYGLGRLTTLDKAADVDEFARFVVKTLSADGAAVASSSGVVQRVAISSGAWDGELTKAAVELGADTVLTGEIKHSELLTALASGLNVIAAGHFATEQVICPVLAHKLSVAFQGVKFELAKSFQNSTHYIK